MRASLFVVVGLALVAKATCAQYRIELRKYLGVLPGARDADYKQQALGALLDLLEDCNSVTTGIQDEYIMEKLDSTLVGREAALKLENRVRELRRFLGKCEVAPLNAFGGALPCDSDHVDSSLRSKTCPAPSEALLTPLTAFTKNMETLAALATLKGSLETLCRKELCEDIWESARQWTSENSMSLLGHLTYALKRACTGIESGIGFQRLEVLALELLGNGETSDPAALALERGVSNYQTCLRAAYLIR